MSSSPHSVFPDQSTGPSRDVSFTRGRVRRVKNETFSLLHSLSLFHPTHSRSRSLSQPPRLSLPLSICLSQDPIHTEKQSRTLSLCLSNSNTFSPSLSLSLEPVRFLAFSLHSECQKHTQSHHAISSVRPTVWPKVCRDAARPGVCQR